MLTRVPIVKNFDHKNPIGQLTIETSELPASPDYCFALGYIAKGETHELLCVSIVRDANYQEYLAQRQADKVAQ